MGKMFMLLLASCLFSAAILANADEQAQEIANIGKFGQLKLRSGVYAIVGIEPPADSLPTGGLVVVTMDQSHNRYLTLFGDVILRNLRIDKDKFVMALQNPKTVIACKTKSPIILYDMRDFILCRHFTVDSSISIGLDKN
jgi:hypothetical protein